MTTVIKGDSNINLDFSTGGRITGDFSNSTLANRAIFQSSTTNGASGVIAVPNGTGVVASWSAQNSSDVTNGASIAIRASDTDMSVRSGIVGTGSYLPMTFYTGGSERMRLDTSGNFSIGNTGGGYRLDVTAGDTTAGFGYAMRLRSNATAAAATLQFTNNAVSVENGYIRVTDAGLMSFSNKAYIDSSGTLLVGQTTNPATSTLVIKVPTGSANGVNAQITSNTGTSYPWSNYNASGTYVGGISCTSTGTAFPTSSDYRLKEDVQPMAGALTKVALLKPCTYKWKLNGSDGQGFIAHELAEVCPDAVIGEKDAVDADGNPQYQGIDTSFLVATLTAAIQELNAKVDAQAVEIAALKGQA